MRDADVKTGVCAGERRRKHDKIHDQAGRWNSGDFENRDKRTFRNAGIFPRHYAHQHGHRAHVNQDQSGKGDARCPCHVLAGARFAGRDGHHLNAKKAVKPKGNRHQRGGPSLRSKAAACDILRLHLAGKKQRRAHHDEHEDRDNLEQGKPVFKRAVMADGKEVDREQKKAKCHHPHNGRNRRIPLAHISGRRNHLRSNHDDHGKPVSDILQ